MRKVLITSIAALISNAAVQAQDREIVMPPPTLYHVCHFGVPESIPRPRNIVGYSNIDNFSGFGAVNSAGGPSGSVGGFFFTTLLADDIAPASGNGVQILRWYFSVANLNDHDVTCRVRLRFWNPDNATTPGAPGTYHQLGVTYAPITFPANLISLYYSDIDPTAGFVISLDNMWAGQTYDDNDGMTPAGHTGATLADLDNMGVGLFDPPTVGTSQDAIFITTQPGSFFNTPNPVGQFYNFGHDADPNAPAANVFWEFEVQGSTCSCTGDIAPSGAPNGVVDIADLALLLANFGSVPTDPCINVDGQGTAVDIADLSLLLAHFGTACP